MGIPRPIVDDGGHRILAGAFDEVWRLAADQALDTRLAAHVLAVGRVAEATRLRGLAA